MHTLGVQSINRFNTETIIENTCITTEGAPYILNGYFTSDFIKVKPSEIVTAVNVHLISYYDISKTFISMKDIKAKGTTFTLSIPENVHFVRLGQSLEYLNSLQFGTDVTPDNYIGYNELMVLTNVRVADKMEGVNVNRFNPSTIISGIYVSLKGSTESNANFFTSAPIAVTSEETIHCENVTIAAYYDNNMNWISTKAMNNSEIVKVDIVIPSDVCYVKICCKSSLIDSVRFGTYETLEETLKYVIVGIGGTFTKLTDALKAARTSQYKGATFLVQAGTYDIISELGSDFWDNYSDYTDSNDMNLGNDVTWIFSPNAHVVCIYTGSNTNVKTYFSPFNSLSAASGSFMIDGLNLVADGVRYAIHDDISGKGGYEQHIYKNCEITNRKRAIGAGFGADMFVEINNCIFHNEDSGTESVSWHNSIANGNKRLVIKDCVFEGSGNTLRVTHYGDYDTKALVLASGNLWKSAPVVTFENASAMYENIKLKEWNNVID